MAELALDDVDRHPFARELNGVRVPQLMGREAAPDAGIGGELAQFGSGRGGRPPPAPRRSVDDAEHRPGRQCDAVAQPGGELFDPNWSIPASRRLSPLPCYAECLVMPSGACTDRVVPRLRPRSMTTVLGIITARREASSLVE